MLCICDISPAIEEFRLFIWSSSPRDEILIEQAGFEEVETWDTGEELEPGLNYPLTSFAVARKGVEAGRITGFGRNIFFETTEAYRNSAITLPKTLTDPARHAGLCRSSYRCSGVRR